MIQALRALVVLPVLVFAACNGPVALECSEEIECTGFGETCVDGRCEVRSCSSSIDCPVEQICGDNGCEPGCENDNDCFPGDICDQEFKECTFGGCVDTHIDCGYKEFCNTLTGDCYEAGGVYCRPCDPRNVIQDCNGGDPAGTNQCWNNYCTVDCSSGRECPSGFQCYPFTDQAGNPVTFQCLTYCWLYEETSGGASVAPPPPPQHGWTLPLEPACAQPSSLLPPPAAIGGIAP